jgi:hypothetical protein
MAAYQLTSTTLASDARPVIAHYLDRLASALVAASAGGSAAWPSAGVTINQQAAPR